MPGAARPARRARRPARTVPGHSAQANRPRYAAGMGDSRPARAAPSPGGPDIARENAALRRLVTVYRHLSGLAAVAELIAGHARATVAVVDPAMGILAAAAPGEPPPQAERYVRELVVHPRLGEVLAATARARRALRFPDAGTSAAVTVAPVLVGDEVSAYLVALDGDGRWGGGDRAGDDARLLLTEHAATICGVILGRDRVVAAAAGRARHDLVEGLLAGRGREDGDLDRWARHLGYDPAADHHVACVIVDAPEPPDRQRATAEAEHFVSTRAPDAIIALREAEVVVVLPEPGRGPRPRAQELGEACVRRLAGLVPRATVTVGIGGACREAAAVATSYAQARRAAETVRRLDRASCVVTFADLGIRRLLLQVPDLGQLRAFAREVLGGLADPDREHAADYLATLSCYFRENGSLRQVSARLHVHPNTVSYRLRRVEALTGLDLASHRDRLMAQVALEILDAVGGGPAAEAGRDGMRR